MSSTLLRAGSRRPRRARKRSIPSSQPPRPRPPSARAPSSRPRPTRARARDLTPPPTLAGRRGRARFRACGRCGRARGRRARKKLERDAAGRARAPPRQPRGGGFAQACALRANHEAESPRCANEGAAAASIAAEPAIAKPATAAAAAATAAPAAGDAVRRIFDEVGCDSTTPAHMPGALAALAPAAPFDALARRCSRTSPKLSPRLVVTCSRRRTPECAARAASVLSSAARGRRRGA